MIEKLFINWELEAWANVLEVVGFVFAVLGFLISLRIKSEVDKLKTSYIFDKRIKKHLDNLKKSASEFNRFLNDYDKNRTSIRTEFGNCISELEDLITKINSEEAKKSRNLKNFLKSRRDKSFVKRSTIQNSLLAYLDKITGRFYKTTYEDIWKIYDELLEIIRQMENIKQNKDKSLKT